MIVLSETDLAAVALSDADVRAAVEAGLDAQALGTAIAEPTSVFNPVPGRDDLIAVIRGALPGKEVAMVKTVGGFPGNAAKGLATNPGCLTLIETETGQITGLLPAATITTNRTAMVTAIGAALLASPEARVLGCIGTRGVAAQSLRYIVGRLRLDEVRIHARDPEATRAAASALTEELGIPVRATAGWAECMDGADILIDGSALPGDAPLFPAEAIRPGALVIAYGARSSLPLDILDQVDCTVMDRWVGDNSGALGPHTAAGKMSEQRLDALIGDVIGGRSTPRQSPGDRILFVHRGVAACDLMLADAYLAGARARGLGTEIGF